MATGTMDRIFGSFAIFIAFQVFLNYILCAILIWLVPLVFSSELPWQVHIFIFIFFCGLFTVIRAAGCGFFGFKWWNIHGRGVNNNELIRGIPIALLLLSPAGIIVPIFGFLIAFGADITFLTLYGLWAMGGAAEGPTALLALFSAAFVAIFVAPVFPFIFLYAGYFLAKYTSKKGNLRNIIFGSFSIFMVFQVFLNYIFITIVGAITAGLGSYSEPVFDPDFGFNAAPATLWLLTIFCGLLTVIRAAGCGFFGFKWWNIHGRGVKRNELIRGILLALALLSPAGIVFGAGILIIGFGAEITYLTLYGLGAMTSLRGEASLILQFPAVFAGLFVAPVFPFIVFYAGYSRAKQALKKENLELLRKKLYRT